MNLMGGITIYPDNQKQFTLLQSLFEEMKLRYKIVELNDSTLFTEEEYVAKIKKSIQQADKGETVALTAEKQKELLGL